MVSLLALTYDEYNVMVINSMILCFVFLIFLFYCHARHWNRIRNHPLFFVYFFTILTIIGEIVWMFVEGKKNLIWLNYITNMFSLGGCPIIGYFWLIYCFKYFPHNWVKKKWVKSLFLLPALLDVILIVLSPVTKLMFYINSEGEYLRGPLFFIQSMGYLYLLLGSFMALFNIRNVNLSVEKAHMRILIYAAFPCIIISGVQFFLPAGGLPYFQFAMLFSLFGVFVHDEERRITVDTLTKLKTRYEFEKILNDRIKKIKNSNDRKLYVIAGDINDFKSINDNYGHLEGDYVMESIGDIMDKVSTSNKGVACRRSGDEFLILVEGRDISIANNIIKNINDELAVFNKNKEYSISIGFGISEYDGKESLIQFVHRADVNMYQVKKNR